MGHILTYPIIFCSIPCRSYDRHDELDNPWRGGEFPLLGMYVSLTSSMFIAPGIGREKEKPLIYFVYAIVTVHLV